MTETDRDRLKNYFKYYCVTKQIQSKLKLIAVLLVYFGVVAYVFIYNRYELNILQNAFYLIALVFLVPLFFNEIKNLLKFLYYFSDGYLKENIIWEEGRIKHMELGKLGARVVVTDEIGDPYIAYYANELVSDLYEDGLPIEIPGCMIYLRNKKKEFITAYPCKYLDKTKE